MGIGATAPTMGIVRGSTRCGIRMTTPNVAGRSFGVRLNRSGRLIVAVRGGGIIGRRSGGGGGCLHHRFSCTGFRGSFLLPRSIRGSGIDTGMDSNILGVLLPGHDPRRGTGIGEIVRIRWPIVGEAIWSV